MKAKEIAMVIGIAILTSFFFGLFVDALYEKPEQDEANRAADILNPASANLPFFFKLCLKLISKLKNKGFLRIFRVKDIISLD